MDYEEILTRAATALSELNANGLVDCYASSFKLVDVPSGSVRTEKEQLQNYYEALFSMKDVQFTDVDFFCMGDRAAGEWTWHGRSSVSGDQFAIRGASLFKLSEEGIVEEILFYDPRPALG